MKPADVARALAYPVIETSVLIPLIVFWLLVTLASMGGFLGLFVIFLFIIPAVFRFQMIVLEARARDVTPATPGIEFFNWFGKAWSVFPLLLVVVLTWMTIAVAQEFGLPFTIIPIAFASVFFPASIAVLAITHSPLQSLNPLALARLWQRCGKSFWIATLFLIASSWLVITLADFLAPMLANFVQMLLSFSFFSLVGALIAPYGLIEDIELPAPQEKSSVELAADLDKSRTAVLNHAYGFISRGNREGGFEHVFDWIRKDPDPVAAWAWFFDRMLRWENQATAMFFAQHYLHDQLQHGEQLPAVKLMMRCRLVDEFFRPLPDDLPAAIAACDAHDNAELAAILKRN